MQAAFVTGTVTEKSGIGERQLHGGQAGTVAARANSDDTGQLLEGEGKGGRGEEPVSDHGHPQSSFSFGYRFTKNSCYYCIQDLDMCYTSLYMCQMLHNKRKAESLSSHYSYKL